MKRFLILSIILSIMFLYCSTDLIDVEEYKNEKDVIELYNIAKDPSYDMELREASVRNLGIMLDDRSIPLLTKLMKNKNEKIRCLSAEALKYYPSDKVISTLKKSLKTEQSYIVKMFITDTLLDIATKNTVAILKEHKKIESNPKVKKWINNGLISLLNKKKKKRRSQNKKEEKSDEFVDDLLNPNFNASSPFGTSLFPLETKSKDKDKKKKKKRKKSK